jgi:hypothetical protein
MTNKHKISFIFICLKNNLSIIKYQFFFYNLYHTIQGLNWLIQGIRQNLLIIHFERSNCRKGFQF